MEKCAGNLLRSLYHLRDTAIMREGSDRLRVDCSCRRIGKELGRSNCAI
jgi:hypothetical protein